MTLVPLNKGTESKRQGNRVKLFFYERFRDKEIPLFIKAPAVLSETGLVLRRNR